MRHPATLAVAATLLAAPALAGPKVLLCLDDGGDGSAATIQKNLKATAAFDLVDLVDCASSTPTLATLKKYEAVLVFDAGGYDNPTGLGNNLADYVDAGGGVVSTNFNFDAFDGLELGGRWATGRYDCILPDDIAFVDASLKKPPNEPNSPLVQGITNLTTDLRPTGKINVAGGAVSVWDWNDGTSAVCRMTIKGRPRVDLGFYPGDGVVVEGKAGDVTTLLKNSLLFVAGSFNPLQGAPSPANFPDTGTGAVSNPIAITFTNKGMKQESVTALAIAGTDKADFVLTKAPPLPLTVAVGASFTVEVAFKPTVAGARAATVAATVAGFMQPAEVSLTGKATPSALAVSPYPIALGGTPLGVAVSKVVTVANIGGGKVNVTGASITMGAPAFSMSNAPGFPVTLIAGGSFTVTVTFKPILNGPQAGVLTVTSTDPNTPSLAVAVTGCAGPGAITVDTGSIAYGNVNVGAVMPQTVMITNSGCADLKTLDAALSGPNAADFVLDKTKLLPAVGAGGQVPLGVAFKPTAVGMRTALVTITSSAGSKVVNLLGNGTTAMLKVTPAALDFKNVRLKATSAAQNLTLANSGNGTLRITAVTFGGKNPTSFATAQPFQPLTVGPNQSLPLAVVASPQALGAQTATVTVVADTGMQVVMLAANAVAPQIAIKPALLDFGRVPLSTTSKDLQITITNNGTDALKLTDVSIGGPAAQDFDFGAMMPKPGAIAPKASQVFAVHFVPSERGNAAAEVVIATDDPLTPSAKVTLKGVGIEPKLEASTDAIDFGTVPQGSSKKLTLTLTSSGDGPITIKSIAPSGPGASQLTVDKPGGQTIAMSTSSTVSITFTPIAGGALMANLNVTAVEVPVLTVTLSGTGGPPSVQVSPMALDFGPVEVGQSSPPQTITVRNVGGTPLAFEPLQSADPNFVVEGDLSQVAPGTSATFTITLSPQAAGTFNSRVNLTFKGQGRPAAQIAVTGSGVVARPRMSGGCKCTVGEPQPAPWSGLVLAGMVALVALRRRRRVAVRG